VSVCFSCGHDDCVCKPEPTELEATEAERLELHGYLREIHLRFGRCNFSELPKRVGELLDTMEAALAKAKAEDQ
jgi:hypothetical protein